MREALKKGTAMKNNLLPEWLLIDSFYGEDPGSESREENEDLEDEDNEEDSDDLEENPDDENDEGDDEDEEDEGDEGDDEADALRQALRNERRFKRDERQGRIRAERERDDLQARLAAGTEQESEAIKTLQTELDKERKLNERFQSGFVTNAVHTAIAAAATKVGFIDPEDALVVARRIEADQDPDDPTQVDIDEALVLSEVKALGRRKPHLLGKGKKKVEPKPKSGTPRSRRTARTPKKKAADQYLADYPSLR